MALGCMPPPRVIPDPVVQYPPISAEEYAPYLKAGTAQVTGQAFLKTRGGDVKVGAGSPVTLDPITSYSRPWWNNLGSIYQYRGMKPDAPEFSQARKEIIADAQGRFVFSNVPAGSYFLRSEVTWEAPSTGYLPNIQGGLVFKEIVVKEGEKVDVILTW